MVEAARFIEGVQTVISREKEPNAFGVVSIGSVQAGSAPNIIPDQALVRGTIRTRDVGVREKMLEGRAWPAHGERRRPTPCPALPAPT